MFFRAMEKQKRLLSLDIARGFDMFFIMGVEELGTVLFGLLGWEWMAKQMHHPYWHGFTFIDTVFPTFLFLAGLSSTFSLNSQREKGRSDLAIILRIVRRVAVLIFLGLVYNGLLCDGFHDLRYASVLGRIGLSWGIAAVIYLYCGFKTRLILAVLITAFSYAAMKYLPGLIGLQGDPLSLEGNILGFVDRFILPGYFVPSPGVFDVEGLAGTVPAVATALLGTLAGDMARRGDILPKKKLAFLFLFGVILVVLGLIVSLSFPINKKLWSPSFVLVTGGYSTLLFWIFYYLADYKPYGKYLTFFKVIGMNSITIYMLQSVVYLHYTNKFLFGAFASMFGGLEELVLCFTYTALCWLILYFLYKKEIFLKV